MQPRTELAFGTALVLVLSVVAGLIGLRQAGITDADPRRSTYLTGPSGSRGFAEALARLGVQVERYGRPLATLDSAGATGTAVAILGPAQPLTAREGVALAAGHADLLLAGLPASSAIRCFGYEVRARYRQPAAVVPPPGIDQPFPRVVAVLVLRASRVAADSGGAEDGAPVSCTAPIPHSIDTLLRTRAGSPVALRLGLSNGRRVTLVADDLLFSNRALRTSGAGPFALGLALPYRRVLVDEYHHGFSTATTLAGATRAWLLRSPWGWVLLQLAGVSGLAVLAAGVRFGPVQRGVERRRRSPLEHVRALATALAAARGHDVAVDLLVQGLRRRLSRAGQPTRGDAHAWLAGLAPAVRTPRGAAALAALTTITGRPASADDVLQAALAVETLWEELTPS